MTIAISWVRKVQNYEQLVFVSDSRISGGESFDGCPKILRFARTDCAVAFAGVAAHAFPMMEQLGLAIEAYPKMARGAHEITRVKTHALKVLNTMLPLFSTTVRNPPAWLTQPGAEFIFGGYNWKRKEFQLWNIRLNHERLFAASPAKYWAHDAGTNFFNRAVTYPDPARTESWKVGPIAFAGDQAQTASDLLQAKMLVKARIGASSLHFDMEPFEVVRDMLRDPNRSQTIGGPPQVVKVFQYLRSAPFAVYWPSKAEGIPYLHGRPVLAYEALDKQVIDPDTLAEESVRPRATST